MNRRAGILLLILGLGTGRLFALTDEEIFREFRFNLINPGARSLALGGAFVSLADDATAAQANPSGLSYLLRPEYFVELRGVDNGGQAIGLRDTLPGGGNTLVATGTDLNDVGSITFASAVVPIKNITLGFSRQVALNTENSTLNSFEFRFDTGSGSAISTTEGSGAIDVMQTNLNASIGFRVSDRLAFGASLSYATLDVTSEVKNIVFDPDGNFTGQFVLEPTLDTRTRINDTDRAFGYSLGALFRPAESFNLGAVYRRAPKFSVEEVIDPGLDTDGDGTIDQGIDLFGVREALGGGAAGGARFRNEFNMPDSYGIGMSWRPYRHLTFALDIERVEYSDLVDGYVPGINILTGFDARFTADDATDYRLGGEYVMFPAQGPTLAFRAGIFTQSDSTVRALSTGTTDSFATADSFPGRDREIHGTLGLGIVQGRQKIDLGVELGSSDNEYLISYIFTGK
jgi:long-chain fatty acid transport protein